MRRSLAAPTRAVAVLFLVSGFLVGILGSGIVYLGIRLIDGCDGDHRARQIAAEGR